MPRDSDEDGADDELPNPFIPTPAFGRFAMLTSVLLVVIGGGLVAILVATANQSPQQVTTGIGAPISDDEVEAAQSSLQEEVDASVARLETLPEAEEEASIQIAGFWLLDTQEATYQIDQFGTGVTITQFDTTGNITAIANGFIDGRTVFFSYPDGGSLASEVGTGELTLNDAGNLMSGYLFDSLGSRSFVLLR